MRLVAGLALALAAAACDYARVEHVKELSHGVESVKAEHAVLRGEVASATRGQAELRSAVALMGEGFNTLTDSVVGQDVRVERLETTSSRIERDVQKLAKQPRPAPRAQPRGRGIYLGTRMDVRTLQESPVRVRFCEAEQGFAGFVQAGEADVDPHRLHCWRFGDTAVFRAETPQGPRITCLRGISVAEDGWVHALDCDQPAVYSLGAE